jgi:hypothetical protein
MKTLLILLGVVASSNLFGENLESETKAIERAHETVSAARNNFKKALASGECKMSAPPLGAKNENIEVGRTSHKLRNQTNQPRDWVKPILEEYVRTPVAKQDKHKLVNLGPGHYGYVEPLYVEAVCLNCHGATLKPEVRKEITKLYPSDSATGFKLGEFRGLIWLESKGR